MSEDIQGRALAIVVEAIEKPEEQRLAFAQAACGGDEALFREVQSLLDSHARAGHFLSSPTAGPSSQTAPRRPDSEGSGTQIGPYKLLQRIGEGGFGVVWMADQEVPVRRRVALKIIKLGMDTKEVIARFEQERQALAMMEHSNIARVLDAGATETGRPYFVMELVRGMKITEYCDKQGLSINERIELFITVCQAVQHAHQKGIIHRDLKPSNILVTINDGVAVPKVIDFGVAKATQGRLTDGTLFTQFEQMIGTPLYMSPEQAELTSLDVDTRSDIYSLGVLLYELLTGRTPIDTDTMAKAGMDEVRRLILELDPPKPSVRLKTLDGNELTSIAKRRQTDPARLSGGLRGDIDWIVMKCLEKDRKRRYDTANGLAMDLHRHLANDVVIARPPTTAYLLSKLIRRNRLAFAAGVAVAASLVIGIAGSTWQAVRANREAKRTATALDELRETAPAFAEQARALAAREQFADAIAKLDYAIKLRPDAAEYLVAKGDLLQCQLKLAEAAAIYREALRVQPGLARAEASAKLCDELLAAKPNAEGKLSRESLAKLSLAMQQQQRPAAEMMPVSRLLGEERKLVVEYWLARLKDLPVSSEKPLAKRLDVRDDGRLALDLSDTKVLDLSPLAGAPLAALNVSKCQELTDLSPLRGLELIELNISRTSVADLTPLRAMHTLEKLDMSASKVTDLAALGALRLKSLNVVGCLVSDLAPIRNMPLEEISLRETRVADLSPLVRMPIKTIDLTMTPVLDFSPLAQLPLEKCFLQRNRITDLSVLRGKPLKELALWGCADARNYAVLTEIKTLELLLLPSEYRDLPTEDYEAIGALRNHPKLRQLGSEIMNNMGYAATGPKEVFWQDWDREQAFVPALRKSGIHFSLSKLPTGSYSLAIEEQPLRDLTILKGAPISMLSLAGTTVDDLSPLRGMPLTVLNLAGTKVSDISVLRGMPLTKLRLHSCSELTDVSPLAQARELTTLTLPPGGKNVEFLRDFPNLTRIGFEESNGDPNQTAPEFWRDFAKAGWRTALLNAGVKPTALSRNEDDTWNVNLDRSKITGLAILQGAPISKLSLGDTAVADLSPLRGMPLKMLQLWGTKVTDLSPLKGMAIEELNLIGTKVSDISVLRGMPLTVLNLAGTKVSDISVLRGMPLTTLRLHSCSQLTDVSPLAQASKLTTLTLPLGGKNVEFLRDFPNLTRIGFEESNDDPNQSAAEFWRDFAWRIALLNAGVKPSALSRNDDGTWNVNLDETAITDLTILKGAPIQELNLSRMDVSDLTPLRGMPLKTLRLDGTKVADLSPIQGMPLEELFWHGPKGPIDLSALRGMPLKRLDLAGIAVADLSPLRGMPLKTLWLWGTKVTDLSPLKGMAIEKLNLSWTKVSDISVLRGMPLTQLRLHACSELTDLLPLAQARELTMLTLPPGGKNVEFLRDFPNLTRIGFGAESNGDPDQSAAEFWRDFAWRIALLNAGVKPSALSRNDDGTWNVNLDQNAITDLTILKGAPIRELNLSFMDVSDLTPLRGMPLKILRLEGTKVTDLSPIQGMPLEDLRWHWPKGPIDLSALRGMPLKNLDLGGIAVADLSPLRGMPLKMLRLWGTKVTDLSPLKGMAIEKLNLAGTKVSDISVLRGMPLTGLTLQGCGELTDLSPLASARQLIDVTLPPNAKDFEFLRALPDLERLSFSQDPKNDLLPDKTAAEFWQEYGRKSLALQGKFKEAAAEFTRAIEFDPTDHWNWYYQGCLLAYLNDREAYERHCRAMLERFGNTDDIAIADRTAKTCLLAPGVIDAHRLLPLTEMALTKGANNRRYLTWFRLDKALALYRCGDYRGCLGWIELAKREQDSDHPARTPTADLLLAMAHQQLGDSAQAKADLERAEARIERDLPKPGQGDLNSVGLENWLICQTLRREAEGVVGMGQPATQPRSPATSRSD